jgi:hypothetical protein
MIIPKDLKNAYAQFFTKTEAGKYFLNAIEEIIDTQHQEAEAEPTLARDYTQRAKGARLSLEHIQSVVGGIKKP